MLRLFIAVDLPALLCQQVASLMGGVHNARWVNAQQLHITLRFLGETPDHELPAIRDALARIKADSFRLQLRGAGVFPADHAGRPRRSPRVLWLGIHPASDLARLQRAVDDALGVVLTGESQGLSPHLTLARFSRPPDATLADFLARNHDFESSSWLATSFHLYQSTLRREGALHAVLASYVLAQSPPAE
jgi:RNA 2',3'-cyclic 3'-phosphodiesterase